MCFSATACFTAAAILLPIGIYSLGKAYQANKNYLALAALPFLFGLQQIIGGGLWLAFEQSADINIEMTAKGFLFFAYFLWPFFVPLAALLVETNATRRTLFKIFSFTGFLLGASLYVPLLLYPEWLSVMTFKGSILYHPVSIYDEILPGTVERVFYAIIIAVPLLFSTVATLRFFGVLIFVSVAISALFFAYAFVSIWCFFAAILSAYIVYIIHRETSSVVILQPSPLY